MIAKEITINGKTYPIVFNMKAILSFEEIMGTSFFGAKLATLKEQLTIIFSAVLAADEKAALTIDNLVNCENFEELKEILTAFAAVMELATAFFNIPEIEKDKLPKKGKGKEKN